MNDIRRGLLFSVLSKYLLRVLGLISTVLIARMLTPTEIGTFAIASSLVMILTEVKLLGANAYLIRSNELTEGHIRRAYGMAILMCWGITIVLVSGSGAMSVFFKHSELQFVFIILACSFLLAPYISIPDAILSRTFRYKEISIIETSASICQIILTLVLINFGYSFYSLAWGQLTGMVVRCFLYLYFTRDYKIYFPSFSNLSEIAKLGIFTSAGNVVRRIHYSASDIVIGRLGNPTEVGVFSRGIGFIDFVSQLILDGVGSIALPYLTDLKRKGQSVSAAYVRATALLCSIIWPILAVCSLASLPAIRLLFGDQWDHSAPIASILALWMILKVIGFFSPQLLITAGKENLMFVRDVVCFVTLFVLLYKTYEYGMIAMAYAFLFTSVVELAITSFLLSSTVGVHFFDLLKQLIKPSIVALICYSVAYLLDSNFSFQANPPIYIFGLLILTMPSVWLMSVKILKMEIYFEVTKLLRSIVSRIF